MTTTSNGRPAEPLPVFVYGTLRPQFGNAIVWERYGATCLHDGHAHADGYGLGYSHGAFPYMHEAEGRSAVGALVMPLYETAADRRMLADLDALEGVPHHYQRIDLIVQTPDGPVRAWAYTVAPRADLRPVPGDNWTAWKLGEADPRRLSGRRSW